MNITGCQQGPEFNLANKGGYMTSKDLSIFNSLRPFSIGFDDMFDQFESMLGNCLLYTSPSPRDDELSRMPSSA